jgi:hypothetical protein
MIQQIKMVCLGKQTSKNYTATDLLLLFWEKLFYFVPIFSGFRDIILKVTLRNYSVALITAITPAAAIFP